MTYKTILAVLDSPRSTAQVADFAISLSRDFDAHLIGLHAETLASVAIVAPMEIPDPVAIQALQEMAQADTAEVERIYKERQSLAGVSAEWRGLSSAAGYSGSSVIDTARAADLIVAGQGNPEHPADGWRDLESFLFDSGRPILLIPYILREPRPIKRVLIAWNGSREATRATFDALPFLKQAEEVEIFTVDPEETTVQSPTLAGAAIAATLARHGCKVTVATGETNGLPASAVIENRLSDDSIDLLVMGAYTHSRLWEMLFGGVTRTLLNSMTALTLLSR